MGEESGWAPPRLREWPFWRDDMQPEEYEAEREYYYKNLYTGIQDGTYAPLWKQKKVEAKK